MMNVYHPELNEKPIDAEITAGTYYDYAARDTRFKVETSIELKGRGIRKETYGGRTFYKITKKAMEKLQNIYNVNLVAYLD